MKWKTNLAIRLISWLCGFGLGAEMINFKETRYGFEFGDAKISRLFSDDKKGWVTLSLETSKYNRNKNTEIQIYITKTGKVRIHSGNGEWLKPNAT